jgi:hypothetical protein
MQEVTVKGDIYLCWENQEMHTDYWYCFLLYCITLYCHCGGGNLQSPETLRPLQGPVRCPDFS